MLGPEFSYEIKGYKVVAFKRRDKVRVVSFDRNSLDDESFVGQEGVIIDIDPSSNSPYEVWLPDREHVLCCSAGQLVKVEEEPTISEMGETT